MNSVVIPSRPAASPPDAHQVKISRFPVALLVSVAESDPDLVTKNATKAIATTPAITIASFEFFCIYIHSLRR